MATRKPSAKGQGKIPEPNDAEFSALMDEVKLPVPDWLEATPRVGDEAWSFRYFERVRKWVEQKGTTEVAGRLAVILMERRAWQRVAMFDCEHAVRLEAMKKLQGRRGGTKGAHRHRMAVQAEWLNWQEHPALYEGGTAFRLAMELKYPGTNAGTMKNWMAGWSKARKPVP